MHCRKIVLILVATGFGVSTVFAQTVYEVAQPRVLPDGAPRYSDVSLSSRWPRGAGYAEDINPNTGEVYDSFVAAAQFHATRFDWVYIRDGQQDWAAECKARGYLLSGSLNSTLWDSPYGGAVRNLGRLRDINGDFIVLPWMASNVHAGCVNSDEYRWTYLEHAKLQLDAGVDYIQMDDPHANAGAVNYGACYCDYCRQKALDEWGRDLTTFSAAEMLQFQEESVTEFYADMRAAIDAYATWAVPFSCNNGSWKKWDWCTTQFDYAIGETTYQLDFTPSGLMEASRTAAALGKMQMYSSAKGLAVDDPLLLQSNRRLVATSFAVGAQAMVPWDTWMEGDTRYFGEPDEYADLYGFVRANAAYLDGYEDAAAVGPGLSEDRWPGGLPVSIVGGSGDLRAWVRAVPGHAQAPVVVHLVDWANTPQPSQIQIRKSSFWGDIEYEAQLLRPAPYDAALHDMAEQTGFYRPLSQTQLLAVTANSEFVTVNIPSLDPWAMLVVMPAGAFAVDAAEARLPDEILVRFNAPVDPVEAINLSHYDLGTQVALAQAALGGDGASVILRTEPALATDALYELVIAGVEAADGSVLPLTSAPVVLGSWAYDHCVRVAFDNTGAALPDYPVLVSWDASTFAGDCRPSNALDLRFEDLDGAGLPFEVDHWDPQGACGIWVRVPQVDSGAQDSIVMCWGGAHPGSVVQTRPVWPETFAGVWHLNDAQDASVYGNHGVDLGSQPAVGAIGAGRYFDGAAIIEVASVAGLNLETGPYTIEAWIKKDLLDNMVALGKGNGWNAGGWEYGWGTDYLRFRTANLYFNSPPGGLTTDWHHVAFVVGNEQGQWYVDGLPAGPTHDLTAVPALGTPDPLRIGGRQHSTTWFQGALDEVRISHAALSSDWLAASYRAATGQFVSFGPQVVAATAARPDEILLQFDRPLDPATAQLPGYYSVNDTTVIAAALQADQQSVLLTLGPGWSGGLAGYHVQIDGVVALNGVGLWPQSVTVEPGWWAWRYHARLTLNNAGQTEALTDFPLAVMLDETFPYDQCRPGGADLRFVDDSGMPLAHEVETWTPGGDSLLWVKVPSIPAAGTPVGITAHWDGPVGAADAAAVWTSDYSGVWHLTDHTDASPYDHPAVGAAQTVDGVLGQAQQFDGATQSLRVPHHDSLQLGSNEFTVSLWMQKATDDTMIALARSAGFREGQWSIGWTTTGTVRSASFRTLQTSTYWGTASNTTMAGQWVWLAYVRRGNTGYAYVNGQLSGVPFDVNMMNALDAQTGLLIGRRDADTAMFNGKLDEIRIARAARSDAWLQASYLAMTGQYLQWGPAVGPGDFNADGVLDVLDIAQFAQQWLAPAPPLAFDMHCDRHVDLLDFAVLCREWVMP